MRTVFGILILVAAAAFTGIGLYGLWLVEKTGQPAILSLDDFIAKRPAARWVRLTSCKLNMLESAYTQNADGSIKDLYVPVYSTNDPTPKYVHVLLKVTDRNVYQLLDKMHDLKDEAEIMNYLSFHREAVFPQRDVEGLVRFGGEYPESQREVLKKVADLGRNYVVVTENERPSASPAGLFLVAGVLLGLLALLLLRRSKLKKS